MNKYPAGVAVGDSAGIAAPSGSLNEVDLFAAYRIAEPHPFRIHPHMSIDSHQY